jgi:hypothetical protein
VGCSLDRRRVPRTDDGRPTPRTSKAAKPVKGALPAAEREARALASPCRRCGALIGQACRGRDGKTPAATHPRRGLPAARR